jgi:putative ABC transport system permease protein
VATRFSNVRQVVRDLVRRPMFAATVILTVAIGIGATTAAFALIDAVVLTRLPVYDQGRIVAMWANSPTAAFGGQWPVPWGIQTRLADRGRAFAGVAAYRAGEPYGFAARSGDRTVHVAVTAVSGNFFDVLGLNPELGRLIRPDDDESGGPDIVVLSDRVWRDDFGSDPAVLGRLLFFAGGWHRVIGVAPPEFSYPVGTTVWTAAVRELRRMKGGPPDSIGFLLVGRMRPATTLTQARQELDAVLRTYPPTNALYPDAGDPLRAMPRTGAAESYTDIILGGDLRSGLMVLFGAVVLVLVIACANVAGLMLARGISRQGELAIRSALGASRARLASHLFMESGLLGITGGLLGVALAAGLVRAAISLAPPDLPMIATAHLDAGVVLFGALITVVSVAGFGLVPALHTAHLSASDILRAGGRSVTRGPGTKLVRRGLVAAQLALALVVLSGAGLLGRTLMHLQRADLGFDPAHLLFFRMDVLLPSRTLSDSAFVSRFLGVRDRLADRLREAPGSPGLTTTLTLPFEVSRVTVPTTIDGEIPTPGSPEIAIEYALDDFFAIMKTPIRRGRTFTVADDASSPPVAIVSESFAQEMWPGHDPIGHRVRFASDTVVGRSWQVIGVAGDTRYDELAASPRSTVYVTPRQAPGVDPWYVVRTGRDPSRMIAPLERAIEATDPAFGLARTTSGAALLNARLARPRALAALLTALSATALLLAAIGLFGVLSGFVRDRRRELAVRSALGATPAQLRVLVLTQTVSIALAALAGGFPLAIGGAQLLRVTVRDVVAVDASTIFAVAVILVAIVVAATFGPMLRASRVDPRTALSAD